MSWPADESGEPIDVGELAYEYFHERLHWIAEIVCEYMHGRDSAQTLPDITEGICRMLDGDGLEPGETIGSMARRWILAIGDDSDDIPEQELR